MPNVHNGLLLSALWDADNEGIPEFSHALNEGARAELRWLDPLPLTEKQEQRLAWHRAHQFRRG
ncbi:MAG: hypothetical protein E5Y61_13400 [Mesorhizobium sp.]|nr:MAG: hypothetical protein E5Y61_13400 [Mesorhizobium sp.]TIM66528.1 MAG: hypothetical protein E5Y60_19545 [Mesorhizobium sp.]